MNGKTQSTSGEASTIDWQAIHSRLKNAGAAIGQNAVLSGAEKTRIMKARAKAMAREPKTNSGEGEWIEIVEFTLAYERYAVESSFVREVYPLKEFTPLPGTPAFVSGIINVRGQIVSVIDLKKFFGLPEKGLTDLNKVIILREGSAEFGILADAVHTAGRIFPGELQSSLPLLTGVRAEYLKGVTADRRVILDAAKLLSDPAININQQENT